MWLGPASLGHAGPRRVGLSHRVVSRASHFPGQSLEGRASPLPSRPPGLPNRRSGKKLRTKV
jgi:hypothetical protein